MVSIEESASFICEHGFVIVDLSAFQIEVRT